MSESTDAHSSANDPSAVARLATTSVARAERKLLAVQQRGRLVMGEKFDEFDGMSEVELDRHLSFLESANDAGVCSQNEHMDEILTHLSWAKMSLADAKRRKVSADAAIMHTRNAPNLRVAFIGYGAIGAHVISALTSRSMSTSSTMTSNLVVKAVLVRNYRQSATESFLVTTCADAFFSAEWDVCVECAGQEAVKIYGERCLSAGRQFLVTSIGALTDDKLYASLCQTASKSHTKLLLASGAMPAVDWLHACSLGGCKHVRFVQSKPPSSWIGTPAADKHDLTKLHERTILFEGTARETASTFPKNSNVSAMLALATAGLDNTRVQLETDPGDTVFRSRIEFEGFAGTLSLEATHAPSSDNPKTSADVALSVLKALHNLSSCVHIGA